MQKQKKIYRKMPKALTATNSMPTKNIREPNRECGHLYIRDSLFSMIIY